jgi:hypothetical protein
VNVAQFYAFGFVVAVLWTPLWVQRVRRSWSRLLAPSLARAGGCAALVGAFGVLAISFDNRHPWNASPDFLHDRFLVLLHTSGLVRCAVAALIVAVIPLLADHVWRSPER